MRILFATLLFPLICGSFACSNNSSDSNAQSKKDGANAAATNSNESFTYKRYLKGCVNSSGVPGRNQGLVAACGQIEDKDLSGQSFINAQLEGAVFRNVNLKGANLSLTNLIGANIKSTDIDLNTLFNGARFSEETELPFTREVALQKGMTLYSLETADKNLCTALTSNDLVSARTMMLNQYASPDSTYCDGLRNSLRNLSGIKMLVKDFGVNINKDIWGKKILFHSISTEMIPDLVSLGADPNAVYKENEKTITYPVVEAVSIEKKVALIKTGAKWNVLGRTTYSSTTVCTSVWSSVKTFTDMKSLLDLGVSPIIDNDACFNKFKVHALYNVYQDDKAVEYLLENSPANEQRSKFLADFIQFLLDDQYESNVLTIKRLKLFLKHGLNLNSEFVTVKTYSKRKDNLASLIIRSENKNLQKNDLLEFLFDNGITTELYFNAEYHESKWPSQDIKLALQFTKKPISTLVFKPFLQQQYDLYTSIAEENVQMLLAAGVTVNDPTGNDIFPIAYCTSDKCIQYMIEKANSDVNAVHAVTGESPLMQLLRVPILESTYPARNWNTTKALIDAGADLKHRNASGADVFMHTLDSFQDRAREVTRTEIQKLLSDHAYFRAKGIHCKNIEMLFQGKPGPVEIRINRTEGSSLGKNIEYWRRYADGQEFVAKVSDFSFYDNLNNKDSAPIALVYSFLNFNSGWAFGTIATQDFKTWTIYNEKKEPMTAGSCQTVH